jgi:hypothetical protein
VAISRPACSASGRVQPNRNSGTTARVNR